MRWIVQAVKHECSICNAAMNVCNPHGEWCATSTITLTQTVAVSLQCLQHAYMVISSDSMLVLLQVFPSSLMEVSNSTLGSFDSNTTLGSSEVCLRFFSDSQSCVITVQAERKAQIFSNVPNQLLRNTGGKHWHQQRLVYIRLHN